MTKVLAVFLSFGVATAACTSLEPGAPAIDCTSAAYIDIDRTVGIVAQGKTRVMRAWLKGQLAVPITDELTWTSSNPGVASVTGKTVTGNTVGSSTLTATGCGMSDTVTMFVVGPYDVSVLAGLGDNATVIDVNDNGHVLAREGDASVIVRNGVATILDDCSASALDNLDRVACTVTSVNVPGVWENEAISPLFADTTLHGAARGISDSGYVQILGRHTGSLAETLFVWRLGVGIERKMGRPAFVAQGISNDGTVAFQESSFGLGYTHAVVWAPSGIKDVTAGRYSFVRRITDAGYLLGDSERSPGQGTISTVWSPPNWSTAAFGVPSELRDASSRGEIIGPGPIGQMFVWRGRYLPINDRVTGWIVTDLLAISSRGKIVARGHADGSAVERTLLLTPIP